MLGWTGFRQTAVKYDRDARFAGETKYRFGKRLALAVDAVCATTTAPLRLLWWLGAAVAGGGLTALLTLTIAFASGSAIGGVAWLAAAMCLLSGVQLLSLAILGEYVGRTHVEAQARPLYIVAEDSAVAAPAQRQTLRAA
jgi:dolichol-phosphate mannosyltransferase